ncbi:flagellar filament capping protein FliD [Burkholderia plantarii]|nr:flagellar filament capping protein FliD [Burkholderia plantarii]ALK28978.1 flagellar hook-associated 2-like protein [Burkholderia plantarii]WLE57701.1 flagellar filament capping protein FliD [Burkholderia plantarii]GLZ17578.1 flagellar hook-associated protein 2 [Burkholderia plantarii]
MSTISSSILSSQTSNNQLSSSTALQEAAQSIISGSTGNTGMDVNTLVTALVNSKTAAQASLLSTAIALNQNKSQAYTALQTALTTLQSSLATLSDGTFAQTFTATASGSGLTASAGAGAVAGTYQIGVTQIAQSQSLSSPAFGASTQLGTGTMTLTVNGKSSTVSINSNNNTLAGIKDAINNASDNPGVTATIVNGADGAHLVLSSTNSGAANTINVSVNATTDTGLSELGVTSTPSTTGGQSTIVSAGTTAATSWTQSTAAQDAQFTVGGIANSSSTNTVTSAIAGVTLNLTQAAVSTTTPATKQTLTIAADTTKQSAAITTFVQNYNALVTAMQTVGSYSTTAGSNKPTVGALFGDSALNSIQSQLSAILGGSVTSNGVTATLNSLGITVSDGTDGATAGDLVINQTTLTTALTSNPGATAALFNSTNGIGAQMNTAITSITSDKGVLTQSENSVTSTLASLSTQQTALSAYAQTLTTQYNTQFTQLNTVLAEMTTNQNYLTQLFGGTNSAGALATNK